jgi:DNA-binding response OmpR family regulator
VIDAGRLEVQCAGERVDLTATEQQLLLFLTKNQARLPSSRQILCNVWGFE